MSRHVFHVFPAGGHWEVTQQHRDDVLASFESRSQAITWAMELAKGTTMGQLRIYRRDHSLVEEFTFGEEPAFFEFG